MISGKTRLKFYKIGKLKFISHLDLQRTMKGALGRANVPLKNSEGFNPHPKMVFSLPLPVGAESRCEYLDIILNEPCDERELQERINTQLTRELQITAVYPQDMPFQSITVAEYEFRFYDMTGKELEGLLEGALPIEKKSKKGFIEVDLRPKIAGYAIKNAEEGVLLHALLGADSGDFVNPELLVRALERALGRPVEDYSILRLELYSGERVFH